MNDLTKGRTFCFVFFAKEYIKNSGDPDLIFYDSIEISRIRRINFY